MSRKEPQFPWRVVAIAVTLFFAVAMTAWFVFIRPAPVPPAITSVTTPGGEPTPPPAIATPALQGGEAATAPATTPTDFDPSNPEERGALAIARASTGTMELRLFLIVPGLERLIPVPHTAPSAATIAGQVRRAVEELVAWSGTETISPVAPETEIREVWVSPRGIAYIDFQASFYDFSGGGSLGELHTIYGIVATLTVSFPEINAVQFLLEGEELETLAGHVDLTRPILPSDEWVLIETGGAPIQESDASG